MDLKIISWNIRGMNDPNKMVLIKMSGRINDSLWILHYILEYERNKGQTYYVIEN